MRPSRVFSGTNGARVPPGGPVETVAGDGSGSYAPVSTHRAGDASGRLKPATWNYPNLTGGAGNKEAAPAGGPSRG